MKGHTRLPRGIQTPTPRRRLVIILILQIRKLILRLTKLLLVTWPISRTGIRTRRVCQIPEHMLLTAWLPVWLPPPQQITRAPQRQRTHHRTTGAQHTRKAPNVCWTSEWNSEGGLKRALVAKHWPSGLPWGSAGKESACNPGDPGSIPGSGRSAGEGIGCPLQYSWASLVAQLVKYPPAISQTLVRPLSQEDPLEKG